MFRGCIGRKQRKAGLSAHRTDHHDPPLRARQRLIRPEQRTECLGSHDRPDKVHLHLAAEFVSRQFEQRSCDPNAGIVDEPGKRPAVECRANLSRRGQYRRLVGDIEQQRCKVRAERGLEAIDVSLLAHAAEHAKSAIEQQFRGGPADTGGRTGDDNRSRGREIVYRILLKYL